MRSRSCIGLVVIGCALLCDAARADDLNPPPWTRGLPGSTYQEFVFDPSRPFGANPGYINPNGAPQVTVSAGATYFPGTFPGQTPTISTATGWWCLPPGGFIEFVIPNHFEVTPHEKLVYLQISFLGAISPSVTAPNSDAFGQTSTTTPDPHGATGGEAYQTFSFSYPACPGFEIVRIENPSTINNTYLNQVVIDTLCRVPTPGSVAVTGLGVLAAARRRRR